jgi:hypothetical protein
MLYVSRCTHFRYMGWFLRKKTRTIGEDLFGIFISGPSWNSVKQLIYVTVKCRVFFAVRIEFLNNILSIFGFKGLKSKISSIEYS